MKTITFTLGSAEKASLMICANKELREMKQETIASYLIPTFENHHHELEYINELEMCLWSLGVTRRNYIIE